MTPEEIAKDFRRNGEQILASIEPGPNPELARAIRNSFEEGNEQGNGWRIRALVRIEGEGALDILRAALEDTVEVGGIYSNQRNGVIELVATHYLGHPALEGAFWKALEVDPYVQIQHVFPVARAYNPERARAILVPYVEKRVPAAIAALAGEPTMRPMLIQLLNAALEKSDEKFFKVLGDAASEPDIAALLAPHADTMPVIAESTIATAALPRLRALADKLLLDDSAWHGVALRALARLDPADAFDRASLAYTTPDRASPTGRERALSVAWAIPEFAAPLDPRWVPFFVERLAEEDDRELRGLIVTALGKLGPDAARAIVDAPRNDKDKDVLDAIPDAIADIGPEDGVRELLEDARKKAKGKIKRALGDALSRIGDDGDGDDGDDE